MRLGNQLAWIRQSLFTVLRQRGRPGRAEIVRAVLAAQLKVGLERGARVPGTARLFDFQVSYFSSEAFLILLQEVFIERHYGVPLAGASPVIVDGGANIGMSVLLWKHLYPESRVLAFEPDRDTFAMLGQNVAKNSLTNVELVQAALSGTEGELTLFHAASAPGNLGMTTFGGSSLGDRQIVKAVTLSTYITSRVDLLKLDVEGAERDVIRDLADTGKLTFIDQIVMEYHHHQPGIEDRLSEMLAILESHGFSYQFAGCSEANFFHRDSPSPFLLFAFQKRAT